MRALLALLIVACTARVAGAHPLDVGYLRIAGTEEVEIRIDLEVTTAARLAGVPALDPARDGEPLAEAAVRRTAIVTDRGACRWMPGARLSVDANGTAALAVRAACPAGASLLRWELVVLERLPLSFELLVQSTGFAGDHVVTLGRLAPRLELDAGAGQGFADFVWSGVRHIGVAPSEWRADDGGLQLPDGIDHILFVVALLLGGGTLVRLAGIATGFTLGHSVTLALAAFGVVRPPPGLIEPLIALTIAVAAVEAVTDRLGKRRWQLATLFGLIHGFAFANALVELELSGGALAQALVGYNLGVELGQLAIIIVVAPLLLALRRKPAVAKVVLHGLAAVIFVAGLYWFLARSFW